MATPLVVHPTAPCHVMTSTPGRELRARKATYFGGFEYHSGSICTFSFLQIPRSLYRKWGSGTLTPPRSPKTSLWDVFHDALTLVSTPATPV